VCVCVCVCVCVSDKIELHLQNNLLQDFVLSYVFFSPLSPVKGMPVVSPCRLLSFFLCSAHVTNLTTHPKLKEMRFELNMLFLFVVSVIFLQISRTLHLTLFARTLHFFLSSLF
jgi:hypothetical protein